MARDIERLGLRMDNKVSIIVPTYNGSKFLLNMLKNVSRQTYSNYELIVVIDASTDNSFQLIRNNSRMDSRVRIVKNKVNLGASACRNIGIEQSSGSYLAFLDHDDLWHPEKLSKQISFLQKNESVVGVLSNYVICRDSEFGVKAIGAFRFKNMERLYRRWLHIQGDGPLLPSTLVMRSIENAPRFNEELSAVYDIEFLGQLMKLGEVKNLDEFLTAYMQHDNQMHRDPRSILEITNLSSISLQEKRTLSRKSRVYSRLLMKSTVSLNPLNARLYIGDYWIALNILVQVLVRRLKRKVIKWWSIRKINALIEAI